MHPRNRGICYRMLVGTPQEQPSFQSSKGENWPEYLSPCGNSHYCKCTYPKWTTGKQAVSVPLGCAPVHTHWRTEYLPRINQQTVGCYHLPIQPVLPPGWHKTWASHLQLDSAQKMGWFPSLQWLGIWCLRLISKVNGAKNYIYNLVWIQLYCKLGSESY